MCTLIRTRMLIRGCACLCACVCVEVYRCRCLHVLSATVFWKSAMQLKCSQHRTKGSHFSTTSPLLKSRGCPLRGIDTSSAGLGFGWCAVYTAFELAGAALAAVTRTFAGEYARTHAYGLSLDAFVYVHTVTHPWAHARRLHAFYCLGIHARRLHCTDTCSYFAPS